MTRNGALVTFGTIACSAILAVSCHEKCDDPVMLTYRPELDDYLRTYRPGSWWVYLSNSGVRDSVYLSAFREYTTQGGRNKEPCHEFPEVNYIINSAGMDQTGYLHARYLCGQECTISVWDLAPTIHATRTFGFGYSTTGGYGHATVIDTSVGGVTYMQALLVSVDSSLELRDLRALCLAKDIGIVGFITTSDTFTISNFSIP